MSEPSKNSEALGIAVNMEEEGIAFYKKTAERMTDPFAKKMFLSIAEDERRHKRIFEQMAQAEGVTPADVGQAETDGPIARIQAIFKELGRKVKEDLDPEDSQIDALNIAIDMEKKAYDFYNSAAQDCPDAGEQEILRKIAKEENEHWRIFDDTKLYLTDQAEWNIKEEQPVIDGG